MADEEAATSTVRVVLEATDRLTKPLAEAAERVEDFTSTLRAAGEAAAELYVGYESISHLTEAALELQNALIPLAQATNANTEAQEAAVASAEALAVQWGESAESILQAQTSFAQLGLSMEASQQAAAMASEMARATHTSAAEAAFTLGRAYRALGDESRPVATEMRRVADIMTLAETKFAGGGMSAQRLSRDLVMTVEGMKSLGVSTNSALAMLFELQRSGLGGMRGAAPQLLQMGEALLKTNERGESGAAKWGIAIGKLKDGSSDLVATLEHAVRTQPEVLTEFAKSLGITGAGLQFLIDHLADLRRTMETTIKTTSGASDMTHEMGVTAHGAGQDFDSLSAATKSFTAALGDPLLSTAAFLARVAAPILEATGAFLKAHPVIQAVAGGMAGLVGVTFALSAALKLASFALPLFAGGLSVIGGAATFLSGAVGTVVGVIGGLAPAIGAFSVAVLGPVAAVVAGLAALGFAAYELYTNWDKVTESMRVTSEGAKQEVGGLEAWLEAHWHPGEWMARQAQAAAASIVPLNDATAKTIEPAQKAAAQHEEAWANLRNTYGAAMEWIMPRLSAFGAQAETAWTGVTNQFNQAVSAVAGVTAGPLSAALAPVAGAWSSISSAFGSGVDAVIGTAESALSYLGDALRFDPLQAAVGIVEGAWSGIGSLFTAGKTAVISVMETLLAWFRDAKAWFADAVQPIIDLFSALGAAMSSVGGFIGSVIAPGGAGAPVPAVPRLPAAPTVMPAFPFILGSAGTGGGVPAGIGGAGVNVNAPATVTVNVTADTDVGKVQAAVEAAMGRAHEKLATVLTEITRGSARTSFSDPAYGAMA